MSILIFFAFYYNTSQMLQLADMSLTQKAISRIKTGDRAVLDYELKYFTAVFSASVTELLRIEDDGDK